MAVSASILSVIQQRYSCRNYASIPLNDEAQRAVSDYLQQLPAGPFQKSNRFKLTAATDQDRSALRGLGTYGFIKNPPAFIIGASGEGPLTLEDFGYRMELIVLQMTRLGLGTCWLGGTFKRSGFSWKINLGANELLPVISPLGYSSDKRSVVDKMFRFVGSSDKRKAWNELFYLHNIDTVLDKENSGVFDTPLECVRLAPSASNKQPWRIIKGKGRDAFHFYLKRTPGYESLIKDIKLQNVDMGIAMCHFDLSARDLGLKGDWSVDDPQIKSDGMEYIASWTARNRD